jgi:hypothetical protein
MYKDTIEELYMKAGNGSGGRQKSKNGDEQ